MKFFALTEGLWCWCY